MTQDRAIRSILVAGGGIVGWLAAAALKRRAPFLAVTLLDAAPSPNALADRIAYTLPSLAGFHADLGIGDEDAVVRTGAGYRLGTRFVGWGRDDADYVHAYDHYGQAFGATAFHLHWLRAEREGAVPRYDAFAPAAALGRAGRYAPPTPGTIFARHQPGLTLDLPRYTRMIRAFAAHVGVDVVAGEIGDIARDGRRGIAAVALADGRQLAADLYVDATGPEARLRDAIDTARDDWGAWLPCDRVMLADGPPAEPPLLTPVTAHAAGWSWNGGT